MSGEQRTAAEVRAFLAVHKAAMMAHHIGLVEEAEKMAVFFGEGGGEHIDQRAALTYMMRVMQVGVTSRDVPLLFNALMDSVKEVDSNEG